MIIPGDYSVGHCTKPEGCMSCVVVCGPRDVGEIAHPEDQSKYLVCKDGRTLDIRSCPVGRMFDAKLGKCM